MKVYTKKREQHQDQKWLDMYSLFRSKNNYLVDIQEIHDNHIVMNFVHGVTISNLILEKKLTLDEFKNISIFIKNVILDMFNSKSYLGSFVVHRDLGLSNLIRNDVGHIVIVDPNSVVTTYDSDVFVDFKKLIDVLDNIRTCDNIPSAEKCFKEYEKIIDVMNKGIQVSFNDKLLVTNYFLNETI
jgi:serine/threonine protein kinase